MKPYIYSLLAGILAGVIYGVLGVHSPAPPLVALAGLAGILIGEQLIPLVKRLLAGFAFRSAWSDAKCGQHIFGSLPGAANPRTSPDKNTR